MKEELLRKRARIDAQDAQAQFEEALAIPSDDEKFGIEEKAPIGSDGLVAFSGKLNNSLGLQLEAKLQD